MTPKQKANIRAVKNTLCRIDDNLLKLSVNSKEVLNLMRTRIDIDKCVQVLEDLLKSI